MKQNLAQKLLLKVKGNYKNLIECNRAKKNEIVYSLDSVRSPSAF